MASDLAVRTSEAAQIVHRLLTTKSTRLHESAFRYFPYIVVYCFGIYLMIVLVFSCVMREPRFVVRWNKEIRASQFTATESDEEEEEEEDDHENEGDEEAPANENDENGRANRASQKKSTSQALVDPQDIQVQLGTDKGHKNDEDDEFEDKDDARPKRVGRCGSVCRRGGCFYSCGPTYYRYGLAMVSDSPWDTLHDSEYPVISYLLALFRIAAFAYLFYYNIYTIADLEGQRVWEQFAVWVSCTVIAYFFAVSWVALFGNITWLQPQYSARRRAYLAAAIVHWLFEVALVNALFITLLNYLYFTPQWSMRQLHLRLFPAGLMAVEGVLSQLYCRWQSYPVILLLPGAYLVFQWVLVYLDVFSTWADPVLATNDVYSFMAYGGLLLAHLAIYLFLCIGVLTWGKLRLVQFCQERYYSSFDEDEEEEDDEGEEEDGDSADDDADDEETGHGDEDGKTPDAVPPSSTDTPTQPPGHLSGRAVSRNMRPVSTTQATPI